MILLQPLERQKNGMTCFALQTFSLSANNLLGFDSDDIPSIAEGQSLYTSAAIARTFHTLIMN
jgi:hypothetical protein